MGFRGEVTDSRLSPTYDVVNEFLKNGYTISVHDPYIFEDKLLPKKVLLTSDLKIVTKDAELIFISTDHKNYSKLDKKNLSNSKKPILIYDGRNILNNKDSFSPFLTTIGMR